MKRDFDGFTAYSRSKLANILFTYELSERLQGIDVTVNALHPGVIGTKLLHEGWGFGGNSNIMDGAKLSIYLASSSGVIGVSGKYFSDMREQRSSSQSYSKDVRKKLWDISADMVGLNY